MNQEKRQTGLANLLLFLAIFGRLLPHPANVTPVGAIALVGGSKLSRYWRWLLPFIASILSDCLLQLFFETPAFSKVTPFIYFSFALNILLGHLIKDRRRYLRLGVFSILGSLQFFVLSNLGVWFEGLLYSKTLEGLFQCYVAALPFLKNTLLGDLGWSFVLFIAIERMSLWLQKRSLLEASA